MRRYSIFIFIFVNSIFSVKAQDYVLFMQKEKYTLGTIFYDVIVHLSVDEKKDMKIKLLNFPKFEAIDLMLCCEVDTVTWFVLSEFIPLNQKIGDDSLKKLSEKYTVKYERVLKKRRQIKHKLKDLIKWEGYFIYAYYSEMELCDCYQRGKGKYDQEVAYIKKLGKLKSITKEEKDSIRQNLDFIFSHSSIKQSLEDLESSRESIDDGK